MVQQVYLKTVVHQELQVHQVQVVFQEQVVQTEQAAPAVYQVMLVQAVLTCL